MYTPYESFLSTPLGVDSHNILLQWKKLPKLQCLFVVGLTPKVIQMLQKVNPDAGKRPIRTKKVFPSAVRAKIDAHTQEEAVGAASEERIQLRGGQIGRNS